MKTESHHGISAVQSVQLGASKAPATALTARGNDRPGRVDMTDTSTTPRRIQRRRTKGWRMPAGARFVGRGTRYGNPFIADQGSVYGRSWSVVRARPLTAPVDRKQGLEFVYTTHSSHKGAVMRSVELFRTYCEQTRRDHPDEYAKWIRRIKGRDLACWCPLNSPCHADVLLDLANRGGA